jgi:cell division protein FtsQ
MFATRKPRNRLRREESSWQWPQIDWRRALSTLGGMAVIAAFGAAIVVALDQPIDRVAVQGRFQRVSPIDIEQTARERLQNAGLVSVNLAALQHAIEELPWVDKARVARKWPRGLEVQITEQVAAARWGSSGLLNARGELFLTETRYIPPELPRLAGPLGSEALVAQRYFAIQGRLIEGGVRIAALRLDARGAWEIDLDNGVRVRLGRRQVDERFERFIAAALRLVVQRAPEMAYVDMRYTNGFSVGWRGTTKIAANDEFEDASEG